MQYQQSETIRAKENRVEAHVRKMHLALENARFYCTLCKFGVMTRKETQRINVLENREKVYFRGAVFLPFVDSAIQLFNMRFGEQAAFVVSALALIRSNIQQTSDAAIVDIVGYYKVDVPYPDSFRQEFRPRN